MQRMIFILILSLTFSMADELARPDAGVLSIERNDIYQKFDELINEAMTAPRDSSTQIYLQAEALIEKAIISYPGDSQTLSRAAVVNAQLVSRAGSSEQVERVQKIDKYSLEALQADSMNSVALIVQGVMNYRLSNLSWIEKLLANTFIGTLPDASYENSVFYLKRAIIIDDKSPYTHFAMGRTLLAMEDESGARKHLQLAAFLEPRNKIDSRYQRKAKHWLKALDEENDFELHSDGK